MSPSPLLITMGDALGIGPECIVKAWQRGWLSTSVVIGDVAVLRRAARCTGGAMVARIDAPADVDHVPAGCLPVLQPDDLPAGLADLPWGQVRAEAGAAAARCIRHAVALVQDGQGAAIVTAPIHKAALAAAGIGYPGHTEMLQALAADAAGAVPAVRMMLANPQLRVVLVTIHQSLRSAIEAVSFDAVLSTLRIAHAALRPMLGRSPRLAVAGLNPHAGEDGLFGDEERRIIGPAVQAARAEGLEASGPFAPDTVFMRARHAADHPGEFDAVIAMTHDHGLIPVKYLGVEDGVNVTLGLPFVRTSPDHGTAFDIAGSGRADSRSLEAAVQWARRAVLRPSPTRASPA